MKAKKILHFFFSMKFAVGLLIILALACALGSVVPQGNSPTWYAQNYSSQVSGAILLFGLDDLFHCWWFVVLAIILCLDLLGCNLIHMPKLLTRMKEGFTPEKAQKAFGREALGTVSDPKALLEKLGFHKPQEGVLPLPEGEASALYGVKNKIGIWGPWLCHFGMLLVIIGFGLGQMFKSETSVYGVPGQTKAVNEDFNLTIDDFYTSLREDGSVEQYTAALTVEKVSTGEKKSGEASVNHPLNLFGMKFYQNSTGWAATMEVKDADGKVIQTNALCAGEYAPVVGLPDLIVMLSAIYPDYVFDEENGRPTTASGELNNPAYLYQLYHQGEVIGMNILTGEDFITIGDTEIRFVDPAPYTLIQVKRDPFTGLAALGGLLTLLALILSFYMRTAQILAVKNPERRWDIFAYSKKGGAEYLESVKKACESL